MSDHREVRERALTPPKKRSSAKARTARRGRILIPLEPTNEILDAMRYATFLTDGSRLEMHRRYNGLIAAARLKAGRRG